MVNIAGIETARRVLLGLRMLSASELGAFEEAFEETFEDRPGPSRKVFW